MNKQPSYWQAARLHLSRDKQMAHLISTFPKLILSSRGDAFTTLLRAVVGQQISVSAADSVWQRLIKAIYPLTPAQTLQQSPKQLKTCGLSAQKADYLHHIAKHFIDHQIDSKYFNERTFISIEKELLCIKGVGHWTIEMFAIFYLLEPDIFPIKDLGLIKAIHQQYSPDAKLTNDAILVLAEGWRPYRTVATWYLWRSIDTQVVQY